MSQLSDRLLRPAVRERVISDCTAMVRQHLRSMPGLRGITARTVFSAMEALRPDFLPRILNRLLPDFIAALDELRLAQGQHDHNQAVSISTIILHHPDAVVESLLKVSDERAAQARQAIVRQGYRRLRGFARREVSDALPQLEVLLRNWLA